MTSEIDTLKILVAGDIEIAFSLCTKLVNMGLKAVRSQASSQLEREFPKDEWEKYFTLSIGGAIHTLKLDLELHGPWIWELYSVMEPRDYFRRFDAAVLAVDPHHMESFNRIPSFIQSLETHIGTRIPLLLICDISEEINEDERIIFEQMAILLESKYEYVDIETGENLESAFRKIALDAFRPTIPQ